METKGHFWYSGRMASIPDHETGRYVHNYCIINGKTMEYTEWTDTKDRSHNKNKDLMYLGYGEYSHSN